MRDAISRSVPLVLLGAHVDRFPSRVERSMVGRVLRGATHVLPRDEISAENAADLGVSDGRMTRIPDSVLVLPTPESEHVAAITKRYGLPLGRFAAVTLSPSRDESLDDRLVRSFAVAMQSLVDTGRIEAVAVCVQVDGLHGRDARVSRNLFDRLDPTTTMWVGDDLSPKELAALYAGAAVVVARRLHACILSLVGGTPALPIELVSHKTRAVFEDLDLAHLLVPAADARDPERLERAVRGVLDDPASREVVAKAVADARSRLDVVPDVLMATQR
jgi:polysaccharide pyruvyl transferase WcaK-like protein